MWQDTVNGKNKGRSDRDKHGIIDLLLNKYRLDPASFRDFLPEVAEVLDSRYPTHRTSRSPFGLTPRERSARVETLLQLVNRLNETELTQDEARRGLEHCAALVSDGSLPDEVTQKTIGLLVRRVIGKSPSAFKTNTTVPVSHELSEHASAQVSVIRGVTLSLTWDMRLVSISISPHEMKERRRALRFVGIAKDSATNVAEHHDDYLAGADPHASP
jgi:hypothetical protein